MIRASFRFIIGGMSGNLPRDTPGRMLLLCAVLMLPVVVFAWRAHLGRGEFDWTEYPSALGDRRCYTDATPLGENDFLAPNLKFEGHGKGLFRRAFHAVVRDDARMRKVALDSTGRFFVYTEARAPDGKNPAPTPRVYLKAGDNRYIEFGARKYYPDDPAFAAP